MQLHLMIYIVQKNVSYKTALRFICIGIMVCIGLFVISFTLPCCIVYCLSKNILHCVVYYLLFITIIVMAIKHMRFEHFEILVVRKEDQEQQPRLLSLSFPVSIPKLNGIACSQPPSKALE